MSDPEPGPPAAGGAGGVPGYQLAQLNVARLRYPLDDERTSEFVEALDPINALAEGSPGFVWRLTDDSGQSSSYVSVSEDPHFIINLSVWESPDHLRAFVYRTDHRHYLRRRAMWFEPHERPFAVCWWVPSGHRPDEHEAMARLDRLERDGPSDEAFPFRPPFPPPPGG